MKYNADFKFSREDAAEVKRKGNNSTESGKKEKREMQTEKRY